MYIQTSIKVQDCEEIIFQDATRTHKKWSDLPTSQHTTSVGEGILQGMMSRINHYQAKLVSRKTETSKFQVWYTKTTTEDLVIKELPGTICGIGNDSDKEKNESLGQDVQLSPIPIFSRICSVTVDRTGAMVCSWKHFERIVLPCVHLACVATPCHEMLGLDSHVLNFLDLHTMTLLSIGGVATCIIPTNLKHHHTLFRNITCWQ
jgi:hypothetical protein